MKKYIVTLTKEEREVLGSLVSKGKHQSQKILNALILLDCDTGDYQTSRSTNEEIARVLNISMRKIDRVKKRFVEGNYSAPSETGAAVIKAGHLPWKSKRKASEAVSPCFRQVDT